MQQKYSSEAIVSASRLQRWRGLIPGVALSAGVTLMALGLERIERHVFDHPYVEALVLAILLGMTIRTFWTPPARWQRGIAFSAKQILETAVMLLGASVSFAALMASGPSLILAVFAVVCVTLVVSYFLSRALGLPPKMSTLIACGNSICGNSAIAAVAPVIGASADDIASSISFTAILGVLTVLGLPLLIPLLRLDANQYGILAGLTVYAVPQVLAATVPAGLASTQIGTLVKLMRVLLLGPLVVALSLFARRLDKTTNPDTGGTSAKSVAFVPWFIIGFLAMAALRSLGIIPAELSAPIRSVTVVLTVISMAALGLGVDVRVLAKVGGRVTAAVTLSLIFLLGLSLGVIRFF